MPSGVVRVQCRLPGFAARRRDEGLRALLAFCAGCPGLQRIDLQGCQLVSDEGLRALSVGWHGLLCINVANCQQMRYYTWHSDDSRWVTPALYWERTVQHVVSDEGLRALRVLSAGRTGLQHTDVAN